jgi:hypothetical protein
MKGVDPVKLERTESWIQRARNREGDIHLMLESKRKEKGKRLSEFEMSDLSLEMSIFRCLVEASEVLRRF